MSARIFPFGNPKMKLPREYRKEEALKVVRDHFCLCFVILKHAVQKDLPSFSFSGLRFPTVLQERIPGSAVPFGEPLATEMSIFQDHIHDRMALLAQNTRMSREIWQANERTRLFRQFELSSADTAVLAVDETGDLTAALNAKDQKRVIAALKQSLDRRLSLIDGFRPAISSMHHETH